MNTVNSVEDLNNIEYTKLINIKPANRDASTIRAGDILIICEDSGYALKFYISTLIDLYNNINIYIKSFSGNGKILKAMRSIENAKKFSEFSYIIIIYDSGVSQKDFYIINKGLNNGIGFIRKHGYKGRIAIFNPACFEQLLYSFDKMAELLKLENNDELDEHDKFIGIDDYNEYTKFISSKTNNFTISEEHLFERLIRDLTKNTKYLCDHHNSYCSSCWWLDCCYLGDSNCELHISCNKCEFVCYNSFVSGLILIIDHYMGYKFRLKDLALPKYVVDNYISILEE